MPDGPIALPEPFPEHPDPNQHYQAKTDLQRFASAGMKVYWWLVFCQGLVIAGLIGAVVYLVIAQAHATQHVQIAAHQAVLDNDAKWCSIMRLLTATPVTAPPNPTTNVAREQQYELYLGFVTIREEFGCG
jgi:hypothetical protein